VNKKKYSLKSQAKAKTQSSEAAVLMEAEVNKFVDSVSSPDIQMAEEAGLIMPHPSP
jgi:hypothetical protein